MKSYIVRIEIDCSNPLIWRKVVMPAGATFNRLHDVIQNTLNFQSGYPNEDYHLYQYDLPEDNLVVTNDEYRYAVFKQSKKKPQTTVRKPNRTKIDDYLERYGELHYLYDFGDSWEITIKLEEMVDDYYFGYPTLLDGAESAPPEDVGGLGGFYVFLEAYNDPQHRDFQDMRRWGYSQRFREYDPEWINDWIKSLKYKKTEWDKINHDNYYIIEDKYRKN